MWFFCMIKFVFFHTTTRGHQSKTCSNATHGVFNAYRVVSQVKINLNDDHEFYVTSWRKRQPTCKVLLWGVRALKTRGPLGIPFFQAPPFEQFTMFASSLLGILKRHGTVTQEPLMATILWGSVTSQGLQKTPWGAKCKSLKHINGDQATAHYHSLSLSHSLNFIYFSLPHWGGSSNLTWLHL